jgi:hypothetical protein
MVEKRGWLGTALDKLRGRSEPAPRRRRRGGAVSAARRTVTPGASDDVYYELKRQDGSVEYVSPRSREGRQMGPSDVGPQVPINPDGSPRS